MRSIRTFAYAALMGLSMFCVQPSLVSAEEARGTFKLEHEVHWQNCVLRAGEYTFAVKSAGAETVLTLRGINGTDTDAIMLVSDVESPKPDQTSQLVLVSRNGESFVSELELPRSDMTLRFAVPSEGAAK